MALATQLASVRENAPKVLGADNYQTVQKTLDDFLASFQANSTVKAGDKIPDFQMSDALGSQVSSADLLAKGPLLITFYRGAWCPYCNLALRSMQQHLDDFKARGVTFVAMTPELPDTAFTTVEKGNLEFPVLSDVDNRFAKQLGLLFSMPETMRSLLEGRGMDMKARTGMDGLDVPVPATLLIDQKGIVRNVFVEADYTKRVEPTTALQWIDTMQR